MAIKITTRIAKEAAPKDRAYTVWDSELTGFGLVVRPTGAKIYAVFYRMGGRQSKADRITIGRHGRPWTADEARTEARRLLLQIGSGIDPKAERAARLAKAVTITELCDRFLDQHVAVKTRPRTQKEYRRLIEKSVKPRLGAKAVAAVTRADVSDLHHRMRATPRQANHALAVMSKMFSLAEVWGLRPDQSNPCRRIEKYAENKRTRFLSDKEMEALGGALDALAIASTVPASADVIRLLLLTGCRLGEILALKWRDVRGEDGDSALWIANPKGEPRVHPIGSIALAFIAALPRRGEWIFSGTDPKRPLSMNTVEGAWKRARDSIGLGDVRLHDLRHTAGTLASQSGANAFLVRDKLGHKTLAMTGRYVSADASPLRALSDIMETRIETALKAGSEKGAAARAPAAPKPAKRPPKL